MPSVFRIADFELRPQQRLLLLAGQPLHIGGRALDLLALLVAQRHRTVSKAELIDHCWPEQAVEPNNLAVQVWALRRLLGDAVIATVPGRGYQFVADTLELPPPDASTQAAAPAEPPPGVPPPPARPLLAAMFGRSDDLAWLLGMLQRHRLLTVLGPPGVGKTRLAQAVVASLDAAGQAVVLVDLSAVSAGPGLEAALRPALGLADSHRPTQVGHAWLGLLAARQVLLVLDNCEHLAPAVASLASALLALAPGVRLLATSQQPLHLPAEQQMRLQPLPVPPAGDAAAARASPALQLLLARIQALSPGFELTDAELPLALDLCRQLDGLPLAIELAAVRVPALGLQGVTARLGARLHLLARKTSPQRHASLVDALAWSVSLLAPAHQQLLGALAVFNGSFGVNLALQLGQAAGLDEGAVLDGLDELANRSLITPEAHGTATRLRLLETVRAHALAQLRAGGTLAHWRQSHAQAVCAALAADGLAREQGQLSGGEALQRVRDELPQVRAAVAWALEDPTRAGLGHSLTADAWPAMMFIGLNHEALAWMTALLPMLADNTPPRTAGFFLLGLGKLGLGPGRLAPAERHALLLRARQQLDSLGRPEYAMACRQTLAQSACQLGQAAEALAVIDEALALLPGHPPINRQAYQADLLAWRGIALALLGRQDEAGQALAQALPLCVAEGNQDFLFLVMCDLARLESLLGLHAQAGGRWQALTQAATARGVHSHAVAPLWAGLQASLLALGDVAGARMAALHTWQHMAALGCPLEGCLLHAWLLALEGRAQPAMQLLGAGDRHLRLAGEYRLLDEPAARNRLLAHLSGRLPQPQPDHWRQHGETLTPDEVGALLHGAPAGP